MLLVGLLTLLVPTYLAVRADLGKQDAKTFAGGLAASLGITPVVAWDATPWLRTWAASAYLATLAAAVLVLVRSRRTALLEEPSIE